MAIQQKTIILQIQQEYVLKIDISVACNDITNSGTYVCIE